MKILFFIYSYGRTNFYTCLRRNSKEKRLTLLSFIDYDISTLRSFICSDREGQSSVLTEFMRTYN